MRHYFSRLPFVILLAWLIVGRAGCSTLWVSACLAESRWRTSASTSPDESGVRKFLQDYVRKNGFADDKSTRYFDAFVDLAGKGKEDVIVYLMGRWWCGSGGCPTLVLAREGSSYRVVTKISITRPPVRVLTARSHGWHSLAVWVDGGGIQQGYEAELRFDGNTYPISPANPPARRLVGKAPGQVVIPATASDVRNGKPLYP